MQNIVPEPVMHCSRILIEWTSSVSNKKFTKLVIPQMDGRKLVVSSKKFTQSASAARAPWAGPQPGLGGTNNCSLVVVLSQHYEKSELNLTAKTRLCLLWSNFLPRGQVCHLADKTLNVILLQNRAISRRDRYSIAIQAQILRVATLTHQIMRRGSVQEGSKIDGKHNCARNYEVS